MDSFSEGEQDDVTSGGGCVKVRGPYMIESKDPMLKLGDGDEKNVH